MKLCMRGGTVVLGEKVGVDLNIFYFLVKLEKGLGVAKVRHKPSPLELFIIIF